MEPELGNGVESFGWQFMVALLSLWELGWKD